jgi:GNAT superfamily N-acetyltransferase
MKFCYVDESGKGDERVLVVAGIVADSHRMHVTKRDWLDIIAVFAERLKKPVDEFHTKHFYRGNGIWRDLDGQQRTDMMNAILEWLKARNHKMVFSAIDKGRAGKADFSGKTEFLTQAGKPHYWRLAALHLLLSIQKHNQNESKNKGNTVLILDRGNDEDDLADLSLNPPEWTDSFYGYESVVGEGKRQRSIQNPSQSDC